METVRFRKESFVYDRSGSPLQKMYECNEPGEQSGEYANAEVARELEAEIARLKSQQTEMQKTFKQMTKKISALRERAKARRAQLASINAEVARLKARVEECGVWEKTYQHEVDVANKQLAELREAVASVFEKRSNKDGDTKSHDDYVIAMANLKRLAGAE